jgi:hypothetical protein
MNSLTIAAKSGWTTVRAVFEVVPRAWPAAPCLVRLRPPTIGRTQQGESVMIPTYLYQVHDDVMTTPADVQAMYEKHARHNEGA